VEYLFQQVISGVTIGLVFAGLGLALVVIHQGTGVINFAQGEMATLSTFLILSMLQQGVPWWLSLAVVVAVSFLIGAVVERIFVRPVEGKSELNIMMVTFALMLAINGLVGTVWGPYPFSFPSPFGEGAAVFGGAVITTHQLGMAVVMAVVLAVLYGFFRLTSLGLRMRAVAQNPASSRLLGIRVPMMLALGWGIASAIGAIAGFVAAPITGVDSNVFLGLLLYGFAAAALGGFSSMQGAIVGGIALGISRNLAAAYLPFLGNDLSLVVAFGLMIVVLLFRPAGLFGRASAARV
jgi:branched-chain amino acid transport system permease protein